MADTVAVSLCRTTAIIEMTKLRKQGVKETLLYGAYEETVISMQAALEKLSTTVWERLSEEDPA